MELFTKDVVPQMSFQEILDQHAQPLADASIVGGIIKDAEIKNVNSKGENIFNVKQTGADVGDVIIGDYVGEKGAKWNQSASTFTVKGVINATSGWFGNTTNGVSIDSTGLTIIGSGYIRTASGNTRIELSAVNNQLSCYNNGTLVGKIGKTGAEGNFLYFKGDIDTNVPMFVENQGDSNVVRFIQNTTQNCAHAVDISSRADGNSGAKAVLNISSGKYWDGSNWVYNANSTLVGLYLDYYGKGCPLRINNDQQDASNKYGAIRLNNFAFKMNYGGSGMLCNYNNRFWMSHRNYTTGWMTSKICRHENGYVSLGNLSIGAGGGTQTFQGSVTYANQFPEYPRTVITARLANVTNLTRATAIIYSATATTFYYWIKYECSAANTSAASFYWQAEEQYSAT